MLLPSAAPAALMRTPEFLVACIVSFVLNGSLTFGAVHAQFTAFFQQPLLDHLPFWGSVTVSGMQVSLSTDLFVTALVIAWLTAYLGTIQPRKDVVNGKLPPVHPLYLHYGTWWLFPELRRRSPCVRATLLSLHFAICWTLLELALFAVLAYAVLPSPEIPVASYQWIKSAFAGVEGILVTCLTFVAACANAEASPDATPLVHSSDMHQSEPVAYKVLPVGAVAPFSAAIHGQDSVRRVRDADVCGGWSSTPLLARPHPGSQAMAVAGARTRSEVAADHEHLTEEAANSARAIVQDLEVRPRSRHTARAPAHSRARCAQDRPRRHSRLRVAILTVGTRGDVQPFVGLAQALQRAGHSPVICTTRDFARFVEDNGVECGARAPLWARPSPRRDLTRPLPPAPRRQVRGRHRPHHRAARRVAHREHNRGDVLRDCVPLRGVLPKHGPGVLQGALASLASSDCATVTCPRARPAPSPSVTSSSPPP